MKSLGIVVQARMGSTRLKGKMALPFWEDMSLLKLVLRRLQNVANEVENVRIIVATSDNTQDDYIANVALAEGCAVFRGSENDVLDRFIQAARHFGVEKLIRVCADNPFLSAFYLKELISTFDKNPTDYCAYFFNENQPTIKSHIGLFAEATTLSALERVAAMTDEKLYREHVTNFIYANPAHFSITRLSLPAFLQNRQDIRLTTDTIADFTLQKEIYGRLYPKYGDSFSIETLLSEINADNLSVMYQEINNNSK